MGNTAVSHAPCHRQPTDGLRADRRRPHVAETIHEFGLGTTPRPSLIRNVRLRGLTADEEQAKRGRGSLRWSGVKGAGC